MMNWLLPEEELKGLSDDFFDIDFPQQDINDDDDDTNNGEVEDWEAKFQQLDLPLMDDLTSFPCESTSSCGISTKFSPVGAVPVMKHVGACGINSTESSPSPDIKISKMFQSLSPMSVLESSDASFSPQNSTSQRLAFPVKGMRSKRKRPTTVRFKYLHPFEPSEPENSSPGEAGFKTYYDFEQPAKRKISPREARQCTHCETTETPQWREGPNGPKTLCNACGVRFRSGRLVPEYRPASSPTFIPYVHSNSHRKIIEMRRKGGDHQFHTSMIHGVISRA